MAYEMEWLKLEPVTREEYEGLFNAIVRLTDRIEVLEQVQIELLEAVTDLMNETPPA